MAMRALHEFWESGHGEAEKALREWYSTSEHGRWSNFAELRKNFRSADAVGDRVVFNIMNNRYRLIATVDYVQHGGLIRWIGTHVSYDRLSSEEIKRI